MTTPVGTRSILLDVELFERIAFCGERYAPKHGLRELSVACGYGPGGLPAIVRRKSRSIDPEKLRHIAATAKVSKRWLALGEGEPTPPDESDGATPDAVDGPQELSLVPVPPSVRFRELPGWPALLRGARKTDEGRNIEEWVWPLVAEALVPFRKTPGSSDVAKFAKMLGEVEPPPA